MGKTEEREFHDRYVTSTEVRSFEGRFYSDAAQIKEENIAFDYLGDLRGKRLLFYGAGGHFSMVRKFVQRGAHVVAIDISPESVALLSTAAEEEGISSSCSPLVMDCESLDLEDESQDVVFARSIIHHLDTDVALKEIFRVLKPSGKLVALEPLGTNPVINIYRRLTPESRTSGEHPLVGKDLRGFEAFFPRTTVHYLYCLSILAYVYRMLDNNEARFVKTFTFLNSVDASLVKLLPLYRYLCWEAVLCCQKGEAAG